MEQYDEIVKYLMDRYMEQETVSDPIYVAVISKGRWFCLDKT